MEIILPDLVLKGIDLFNQGRYFEAHEELETAWRAEPGHIRELYQGILQVGVACYHFQHANYEGADHLLARSLDRLTQFTSPIGNINLEKLIKDARELKETAGRFLASPSKNFEPPTFPQIEFIPSQDKD